MNKKIFKYVIRAVVYSKNTDGEYNLDTNGEKIIVKPHQNVKANDDYKFDVSRIKQYG